MNVGKWQGMFARTREPQPFGATTTYELGAAFLCTCSLVEDWGCGLGWMSRYVKPDRYRGIDGSYSPFASLLADLTSYRSQVPGVFMRHVLEHNYEWQKILRNAMQSFQERFVLVLFTPMPAKGSVRQIGFAEDVGVPELSFPLSAIAPFFTGCTWHARSFKTDTQYGEETIFFVARP